MLQRIVLLLGLSVLLGLSAPVSAQDATPEMPPIASELAYPPDAEVAGLSRAEWHVQKQQWLFSFPDAIDPSDADPRGERCAFGQTGPVFFLPVPEQDASCTVPPETALLVTVLAHECTTAEGPPYYGGTEAELIACAKAPFDGTTVEVRVTVDGHEVPAHWTVTPLHYLVLPEDNWLGVAPGVTASVASGYYAFLRPLPAGTHTITVEALWPAQGYYNEHTYELVVAPRWGTTRWRPARS